VEATIEGCLDLSFKEGPRKIYVSPEMAQLVHWSAPNVPLVVLKRHNKTPFYLFMSSGKNLTQFFYL
jgi:hypothetical protein